MAGQHFHHDGILPPASARGAVHAVPTVLDDPQTPVPAPLRHALRLVYDEARDIEDRIERLEAELKTLAGATTRPPWPWRINRGASSGPCGIATCRLPT
jgi:hypothetical protein